MIPFITDSRYTRDELNALGFATLGDNVLIDRSCRFFGPNLMHLGSNVRIDANCVFGADPSGITIGSFVHISVGVIILGAGGVTVEDFAGIAANVCIHSSTDDYIGGALVGPWAPPEFRNVKNASVIIRRYAVIGTSSVILPGVVIGTGAAVGALTLVNKSLPDFIVVSGNPMQKIGMRGKQLLEYAARMEREIPTRTSVK
jgi:galactoside O-acetyltransferase